VKGPGSGRESAVRALAAAGLHIVVIRDVTPIRTTAAVRQSAAACRTDILVCPLRSDGQIRTGRNACPTEFREFWEGRIEVARHRDAVCRLCRREGQKLFLKGLRCFTEKCAIEKRNFVPGQHGQSRRPKVAGYGLQLREKQKVKRTYGLLERQFRNYFEKAARAKGPTGENLIIMLERRLDTWCGRAGLASSRSQARQLVLHGHVRVNGKKVNTRPTLSAWARKWPSRKKCTRTPWCWKRATSRRARTLYLARTGARTVQGQGRGDAEAR